MWLLIVIIMMYNIYDYIYTIFLEMIYLHDLRNHLKTFLLKNYLVYIMVVKCEINADIFSIISVAYWF